MSHIFGRSSTKYIKSQPHHFPLATTFKQSYKTKKITKDFNNGRKEGGIVKKGHEEGLRLATSLLQEFELPLGLLPLADVIEVGYVINTGYMWIVQKKKVEHEFKKISKLVSYDTEITGYFEKKRIKKLEGVKAKPKEFMLWPPVSEITVDDPPTGKINFKSLAGITKNFLVEAFAAGQ